MPDLVLILERQCKAVDDAPKDLQEFCDAAMLLCFPDKSVEDIIDGLPNKRPMDHELPVNPADHRN